MPVDGRPGPTHDAGSDADDLTVRGGVLHLPGGPRLGTLGVRADRISRLVLDAGDGTSGVPGDGDHTTDGTGGPFDPPLGPTLDARGLLVAPGLVDLQINGGHGHDLWRDPASLWELAPLLPRHGVTAFCPTIVSGPSDRVDAALDALSRRPVGDDRLGAEPLGLHLEGPMLAPAFHGAHRPEYLRAPDPGVVEGWTRDRGVAIATLAPELDGAGPVIDRLRRGGVVVAAGHTAATAADAETAIEAGVTLVTHLFNAMAPIHHRDPGLVGRTLAGPDLVAGLIADGIHVDPVAVRMAARALLPDRLVLVTDAVAAMGLGPGTHRFGDGTVTAGPDGVRNPDGGLAGTDLTLDRALRNLVAFAGLTVGEALPAVTANPARVLGLGDRGRLETGAIADLVLLDDGLEVVATICRGRIAHLAEAANDRLLAD